MRLASRRRRAKPQHVCPSIPPLSHASFERELAALFQYPCSDLKPVSPADVAVLPFLEGFGRVDRSYDSSATRSRCATRASRSVHHLLPTLVMSLSVFYSARLALPRAFLGLGLRRPSPAWMRGLSRVVIQKHARRLQLSG